MMKVRQDIYDTYWRTAVERQNIFFKRLRDLPAPYTSDLIYQVYKFCNVYRASDRVSQFLIKNVIYSQKLSAEDILFRIFLFRLLNKAETWRLLEERLGEISLKGFSFERYSKVLEEIRLKQPIYGNAFILCANKAFGYDKKHQNHLALLDLVFNKGKVIETLLSSKTLKEVFESLRSLPLIGNFMAYQIAVDFNYSKVFDFDENDFTIAGPGAERGIKKCFMDTDGKNSEFVIQYMVNNQEKEFERLGLGFKTLFGRSMHAIDCQGWFCEIDKYSRAVFPELKSNRTKIKSKYTTSKDRINFFYPPKWGINQKMEEYIKRT